MIVLLVCGVLVFFFYISIYFILEKEAMGFFFMRIQNTILQRFEGREHIMLRFFEIRISRLPTSSIPRLVGCILYIGYAICDMHCGLWTVAMAKAYAIQNSHSGGNGRRFILSSFN